MEASQVSFKDYLKILTHKPWRSLREFLPLSKLFKNPLRALAVRHYKGPSTETELKLVDGRTIRFRAGTFDRHFLWSVFLKDTYRTSTLPAGRLDTVVDVGAQIGSFSLKIAPRAGQVLSFEPVPENFNLLQKNISSGEHNNVVLYPNGVAGKKETLRINLTDWHTGGHSAYGGGDDAETPHIEIEALCLPEVLEEKGVTRIQFLKMDCEGAEYDIIKSLEDWGLDQIDRMAMEYHDVGMAPGDPHPVIEAEERLRNAGFQVENIPKKNNPGIGMLFATQKGL